MTTVAELEVMLVTNISKYRSGLSSAKSELSGFEGHNRSVVGRMEREWTRSLKNIVMGYIGLRAAWGLVRESVQDGIDQMSFAIRSELAPELEGINKMLSDIAHSDVPARIAALIKEIGYSFYLAYLYAKEFYQYVSRDSEGLLRTQNDISNAWEKWKEASRTMVYGTNKLNTDWSKFKENVKETGKEVDALKAKFGELSRVERAWLAAGHYLGGKGEFISQKEVTPESRKGIRQTRNWGEVGYQPLTGGLPTGRHMSDLVGGGQSIINNISINIDTLKSTDAPFVISSKIAQAIAGGATTANFKP